MKRDKTVGKRPGTSGSACKCAASSAVCTVFAETPMDPFTGLATQEWRVSERFVDQRRPLRLNVSRIIETERRPWQFGRVIAVNISALVKSSLQVVEVGAPLSALPPSDREFSPFPGIDLLDVYRFLERQRRTRGR